MGNNSIWFVEDDANDVFLIDRAMRQTQLPVSPRFARSLEQLKAIFIVAAENGFWPCAIVTDLKLNGEDGFGVLQWVKTQPKLASVPTIVLSSSSLPQDVEKARSMGTYAFLTKTSGAALVMLLSETLGPLLGCPGVGYRDNGAYAWNRHMNRSSLKVGPQL